MSEPINNEILEQSAPCTIDWPTVQGYLEHTNKFETSTDTLGGINGVPENDGIYGAEFMPTDVHTPFYETMVTQNVRVPWFGHSMEDTFMNNTKILNEDPVKEYQEGYYVPIDQNVYQNIEGFGYTWTNIVVVFLIIVLIFCLVKYFR